MSKQNNLKDFLTDLADEIRAKKGTTGKINPQNFRAEIESIQVGSNSTFTTATLTANGTYSASSYGADGFESVTVKTPVVPEWDGYVTKADASGEIIPTAGLSYRLSSNGTYYECSGMGTATATDIVIASTYNGLPVTSCTTGAFYWNGVTVVTLGGNMTSVGQQAFDHCSSLKKVVFPSKLVSISSHAFGNCPNLSSVTLPDSVTTIKQYAFKGCTGLKSITIGSSVTSIEYYAFDGCSSLTDVYYNGTETEWKNKVKIATPNAPLLNATIHYNS